MRLFSIMLQVACEIQVKEMSWEGKESDLRCCNKRFELAAGGSSFIAVEVLALKNNRKQLAYLEEKMFPWEGSLPELSDMLSVWSLLL